MKKLTIFLVVILTCLCSLCFAAGELRDNAKILNANEQAVITRAINNIQAKHNVQIGVYTSRNVKSETGKSDMGPGANYIQDKYYSNNSIVLVLSTSDRKWYITTKGSMMKLCPDAGVTYIENKMLPYLKANKYANGFFAYVNGVNYILNNPDKIKKLEKEKKQKAVMNYGLIYAGILLVYAWRSAKKRVQKARDNMRNVEFSTEASDYMTNCSVLAREDVYVETQRVFVKHEKESSSSSSGSHGGHGGSY